MGTKEDFNLHLQLTAATPNKQKGHPIQRVAFSYSETNFLKSNYCARTVLVDVEECPDAFAICIFS
jgi:hypothetical protein